MFFMKANLASTKSPKANRAQVLLCLVMGTFIILPWLVYILIK